MAIFLIALLSVAVGRTKQAENTVYTSVPHISKGLAVSEPRVITDSVLERFRNDSEFDYSKEAQKGLSWSDLFQRWLLELLEDIFSSKGVRGAWGITKYILIAAAALAIIFLFSKTGIRSLFSRSDTVSSSKGTITENIHEIDFSASIAEAVSDGDYVRAVSLLYLQTLKYLADAEIIAWSPEKTNRDYEREISKNAPQSKEDFIFLTNIFERVCYGKYNVTSREYKQISDGFENYFVIYALEKEVDSRRKIFGRKDSAE